MFNRWPKVTNSWRSFPACAGFQAGAWADPVRWRTLQFYKSFQRKSKSQLILRFSVWISVIRPLWGTILASFIDFFETCLSHPPPKLNVARDLKIFRLIYDCQIGKVFESPTGLEQGTSCPLDMPWLPLPGCAGDQNNLSFRWLHGTRTICK